MPRNLIATRYVTPLREGGSLPAVVEADDDGLYVAKFRGAGQGPKALVAELVAGEIARALGLPVPEIVFLDVDAELARTEADSEIQHLIQHSAGTNIGLDYLPGAITFDPVVDACDADLASAIVWFDAFVQNVDRTARNTNLLVWHRAIQLIDHGAALYFHHDWSRALEGPVSPFPLIADHVLLPRATALREIDEFAANHLSAATIEGIVALVPDDWLLPHEAFSDAASQRKAYVDHLCRRFEQRDVFLEEALRAHARHV